MQGNILQCYPLMYPLMPSGCVISRRIFSDGVNDVYVKKGGLNDAIKDFYALNHSDVKHIVKYGTETVRMDPSYM